MRVPKLTLNLLVFLISLILALLFAEVFLRYYQPFSAFDSGAELDWMRNNQQDLKQVFTVDPEFGFRPILGTELYSDYGTHRNVYRLEKPPHKQRLLFIGDSVTSRGHIVHTLRQRFGDADYEYWNAGVESFNTIQAINFYEKFNYQIQPDHVILTFHLNDFETTPISFYHQGRLVVYAPNAPLAHINLKLFQYSYIYRALLGITLAQNPIDIHNQQGEALQIAQGRAEIVREVQQHLQQLQSRLKQQNIDFSVVVLPYVKSYARWNALEKARREAILAILKQQQIRHFDLLATQEKTIQAGIQIEELPGDFWHPSRAVSERFADYLQTEGLFKPVPPRAKSAQSLPHPNDEKTDPQESAVH